MASNKLITPKAILSYPHLHAAQAEKDGKPGKFSATLIFTPENLADPKEKALFDSLQAAAVAAIDEKWPGKRAALLSSDSFKKGFRRDATAKGYPEGSIYINVRSSQQPGIVYAFAGPDKKPAVMAQEDIKGKMYPGVVVRASVTAFCFDRDGNKGVSFGLNNIQLLGDGPRLDNRVAASDEFIVDLSLAPASLDDLI